MMTRQWYVGLPLLIALLMMPLTLRAAGSPGRQEGHQFQPFLDGGPGNQLRIGILRQGFLIVAFFPAACTPV
jgi:hypothetical protein